MKLHSLDDLHLAQGHKFPFTVICDNGALTLTVHAKIRDHYVGENCDTGDISSDYFADQRIWQLYVPPPKLVEYRRAVLCYNDVSSEPHYRVTEEVYLSLDAAKADCPSGMTLVAMDGVAYSLPQVRS